MRLAYLIAACLPVLGQAPQASSVAKAPGEKVTLEIRVNSEPAHAPSALTWEVLFPAQVMEPDGDAPETGSAAVDAGKSLQCTGPKPYSLVCTLSGGQNAIANGLIAVFHFKIRSTALAGTTSLRVEKIVATTLDSKVLSLNSTEAIVIIK